MNMSEKKQNWLTRLFGGKEQEPPPDDEGKAAPQKVDVGQTMPADTGRNVLASPPNDPQQPEPAEAELRADALNSRGVSLLNSSKPEEALEVFERALTVEPGHPECLYNRGLLLWRRGKLTDEALLALLKETTAQTDTSIQGNYLVGLVHLERGDFEGAVKHLEAACADGEPSLDAKTALKQARTLAKASTHVQTFEGDESPESVVFSSDGSWGAVGELFDPPLVESCHWSVCADLREAQGSCDLGGFLSRWLLGAVG
jgi:tetratricopeptide (TPR) repeat protein